MASQPAANATSSTTQDELRYSINFPQGYGDFALKSSDGWIFHFSQFLLSHASPVFKDMYEIGKGATNDEILCLTEDANTVATLLLFIDPAKNTWPLSWSTVESFLGAADKYQVLGAVDWFKREVQAAILQCRNLEYALQHPMLCLGLSIRYKLPDISRFALRELIKYPIKNIMLHPSVDSRMMRHLFELRAERTKKLMKTAFYINEHVEDIMDESRCRIHKSYRRFSWARRTMDDIIAHPNWTMLMNSFRDEIAEMDDDDCTCPNIDIPAGLEEEIKTLEDSLPNLP
jgi:hypothetical protein